MKQEKRAILLALLMASVMYIFRLFFFRYEGNRYHCHERIHYRRMDQYRGREQ